jgi:hypothetical protein
VGLAVQTGAVDSAGTAMTARRIVTAAMGLVVGGAFAALLVASNCNPTMEELAAVAEPLATIRLATVGGTGLSQKIAIPDQAVWRHARRAWNGPSFLIFARRERNLLGRDQVPLLMSVTTSVAAVPLEPCTPPPYGYSSMTIDPFCYQFEAPLGAELSLAVVPRGSLPPGELIVQAAYLTKDRLVGADLDRRVQPYAWAGMTLGLGIAGLATMWPRRPPWKRQRSLPPSGR